MRETAPENQTCYIAYGSNLNIAAMKKRCPSARVLGTGVLLDIGLAYKGFQDGRSYLTLVDAPGKQINVGVWVLDREDEKALDDYEAYPELYAKTRMDVIVTPLGGGTPFVVSALIYLMQDGCRLLPPKESYVQTCAKGYRDFSFDTKPLYEALEGSRKPTGKGLDA